MFYLWTYLLISLIIFVTAPAMIMFPVGKEKAMVLGPVIACFLWPLGFIVGVLAMLGIGQGPKDE